MKIDSAKKVSSAFIDELEKIALDPATLTVALGGTVMGEKLYKANSKLPKSKLKWYSPRMLAAGALGSVALGELYNRYRKKKHRQPIRKRYGILNAVANKDPYVSKK